jgi:hypothetical protein
MPAAALISLARAEFHLRLSKTVFLLDASGVPTNADSSNTASIAIAKELAKRIPVGACVARPSGQTLGKQFEVACLSFVKGTFPSLMHLRPGKWIVEGGRAISLFDQYAHLVDIERVLAEHPDLKSSIGGDYIIAPDVVVGRVPEPDADINKPGPIVDDAVARRTPLRATNNDKPLLPASLSCKWTIRSDRAQNSRSEALNLIRNRKGNLPHVAVVTCEPMPSRLASLCYGTGDLDCVYHAALPELAESIKACGYADSEAMLRDIVDGKRLRDISDLPLDLAV